MEKKERGFFEPGEGIFLISSNHAEKQEIEDGLNREIDRILTVGDLVRSFTALTTNEGVRASVIITEEIPTEIRKNLEDVKNGIEVTGVPVFEIGTGELVTGAYRFGTIPDFLGFARTNRRRSRISEVKDTEQRKILDELQLETELQQTTIAEYKEEVTELEERLKEAVGQYETLNTEVERVYMVQRDNAVAGEKELRERYENMERLYDIERQKSEEYRKEKDTALGEMTELRLTATTLDSAIRDKQDEIRKLERANELTKSEIKKHIREKDHILKSKVNAEDHVLLSTELQKARKEIQNLQENIVGMEVENRKALYEKELVERENRNLQDGDINIQEIGRTMKLDTYKFERVELIYIKVFENLPYMRLALDMFFEKISKKVDGRAHMMILRHDDGMDGKYFKGVPLWGKLKDVPETNKVFRLFPNHVMFARANEWEKNVKLLVVVDNIKNNEYYLESRSKERYMTVVRRESDLREYELRGQPIALEGSSVFDIGEDSKIRNTRMQSNRQRILEVKVEEWVNRIYE